jgi:hypothetical protein
VCARRRRSRCTRGRLGALVADPGEVVDGLRPPYTKTRRNRQVRLLAPLAQHLRKYTLGQRPADVRLAGSKSSKNFN